MSKHTPTPWKLLHHHAEGRMNGSMIVGPPGDWHICAIWHQHDLGRPKEEVDANAEFIVRAVNAHDDLLEALRYITDCGDGCPDPLDMVKHMRAKVRAAIQAAEGTVSDE